MKKIMILVSFMLVFFQFVSVQAANLLTTTTTISVIREDPGGDFPTKCPDKGKGCTVTTTIKIGITFSIIHNPTTGIYTLTSNVGPLEGTVIRDGDDYNFTCDNRFFEFPSDSEIIITECSDYPEIVGKHISMDGINTNITGDYTVQFTL